MRRINMIIGKKQIIVAGLALIVGVAVYANVASQNKISTVDKNGNYGDTQFVSANESSIKDANANTSTESGAPVQADIEGENNQLKVNANDVTAGDTEKVDNQQSDAYFAQARIDKQKSRDEAVEVLQSMYLGGDLTSDEKQVVAQDAVSMGDLMESEVKVETMLKALGFEDALCYLSGKGANIIVKTENLDAAKAAQIKSTLLSEVDVAGENITIVEVN